jgi:hypothetical protein
MDLMQPSLEGVHLARQLGSALNKGSQDRLGHRKPPESEAQFAPTLFVGILHLGVTAP